MRKKTSTMSNPKSLSLSKMTRKVRRARQKNLKHIDLVVTQSSLERLWKRLIGTAIL